MSAIPSEVPLRARLTHSVVEVAVALASLVVAASFFELGQKLLGDRLDGELARTAVFLVTPLLTALGAILYALGVRLLGEPVDVPIPAYAARGGAGGAVLWVLLGIAAALGGSFLLGQLMVILGVPVEEQPEIVATVERALTSGVGPDTVALIVAAVALAPVTEEWLFRGRLFRRIHARTQALAYAYPFSAAAFAIIHANPSGYAVYAWLGLVFAYAYHRTGRLWAAMLVHMGNNALALGGLFLAE